jgi:hypothetical protein
MKTAVEEFLNAIKDQIPLSNEHLEMIESYALQCKEMEKEKMIELWNIAVTCETFEQYYNETFKSE